MKYNHWPDSVWLQPILFDDLKFLFTEEDWDKLENKVEIIVADEIFQVQDNEGNSLSYEQALSGDRATPPDASVWLGIEPK